MTTTYLMTVGYTKLGRVYTPTSAPTITIVDSGNNTLITAAATTARSGIAGVYDSSYTGADNLNLIGLWTTTDTLADQQDLLSHPFDAVILAAVNAIPTPTATAYVAVTAANAATLAAGNVAFTSYAHTSQVITSTSTEDVASATKVWFALKDLYSETDAQSLIFIEKTAGLTHVGKSAIVSPIVSTDGSLTVSGSSGAWVFTVVLKSEAAAHLADYAGSRKLGEIKATIGGLDKVIGTVTGAINSGVIRANA